MEPSTIAAEELKTKDASENWGGQMTCTIVSLIGRVLTGIIVTHHFNGYKDVGGGQYKSVSPGAAINFTINIGSGHNDTWDVWTKDINGDELYHYGKQCNVMKDDQDTGLPMYVILGNKAEGYSIQLPGSSSCMGNRY